MYLLSLRHCCPCFVGHWLYHSELGHHYKNIHKIKYQVDLVAVTYFHFQLKIVYNTLNRTSFETNLHYY